MKARFLKQLARGIRVLPEPVRKDDLITVICEVFAETESGVDLERFRESCGKKGE